MVSFPPPPSAGHATFDTMNGFGPPPAFTPNGCRRCHSVGCDVKVMDCGCLFHAVRLVAPFAFSQSRVASACCYRGRFHRGTPISSNRIYLTSTRISAEISLLILSFVSFSSSFPLSIPGPFSTTALHSNFGKPAPKFLSRMPLVLEITLFDAHGF
jgi:hypothetical protein